MIHAITAMWAIGKAKKRQALTRICPECRAEQTAAEEKINEPIFCARCGTEIPPKAAAKREAKENRR